MEIADTISSASVSVSASAASQAQVVVGNVSFKLGGGREMVTEERMRELLLAIPEDLDPTHVYLSNKSFTLPAAELLASRLRGYKLVVVADLSDIIAGRPEDEALKVKEQCKTK